MSDDAELGIKITQSVEGTGLKDTANDLKDANSGAKELGGGLGENRSKLREFSSSGRETREIIRGLNEASKGGAEGIRGMAEAFRGFIGLVRGSISALGPAGWLVLGVGALVGLFSSLRSKTKDAGDELRKTGDDAGYFKQKLDEAGKSFQKLFEQQAKQIADVHQKFQQMEQDLDETEKRTMRLVEANKKLHDAQLELSRQTELSKATTPEQAEAINRKFDLQKADAELSEKRLEASKTIALDDKKIQDSEAQIAKYDREIADAKGLEAAEIKRSHEAFQKSLQDQRQLEDEQKKQTDESAFEKGSRLDRIRKQEQTDERDAVDARARAQVVKTEEEKNVKEIQNQKREAQKEVEDAKTEKQVTQIDIQTAEVENKSERLKVSDHISPASQRSSTQAASVQDRVAALKDRQMRTLDLDEDQKLQREIDSLEKTGKSVDDMGQKGGEQFKRAAEHIDDATRKIPPAISPEPIVKSFTNYHHVNLDRHVKNEKAISKVEGEINRLSRQLKNMQKPQ